MNKLLEKCVYATILATVAMVPSTSRAAEKTASVGLGFEFTSGDYGTQTRTNAVFAPLTIAVTPMERWDVSLEIPYVYQSNTNVIAGQFRQMQGTRMGAVAMAVQTQRNGMGGSSLSSSANADPAASQGGLGDITLRTGYVLVEENGPIPQVRPNLFVKFPTADKDRGLGTGEFDEGVALELSKWFGDWYAFVEPGYTIQGKSADLLLKNYVTYNAGAGYQVTDAFRPMFILKGSSSRADGSSSLLEARLKLMYQLTGRIGIEGYLAKGLTDASPDYGVGTALFYEF